MATYRGLLAEVAAQEQEVQRLRGEIDLAESTARSGSGMGVLEASGRLALLPDLNRALGGAEERLGELEEDLDVLYPADPGDASVRGVGADGLCAHCGRVVDSPQCCANQY